MLQNKDKFKIKLLLFSSKICEASVDWNESYKTTCRIVLIFSECTSLNWRQMWNFLSRTLFFPDDRFYYSNLLFNFRTTSFRWKDWFPHFDTPPKCDFFTQRVDSPLSSIFFFLNHKKFRWVMYDEPFFLHFLCFYILCDCAKEASGTEKYRQWVSLDDDETWLDFDDA